MSREIKFRVWNGKSFRYDKYNKFFIFVEDAGGCFAEDWQNFGKALLAQQFTGLLDKNGEEIYEGDIITYRERMHEHGDVQFLKARVIYDSKFAAFGLTSLDENQDTWNYFTDMTISDFEVVGNIFEK